MKTNPDKMNDTELSAWLGEILQPEKKGKHNWSQLIGEVTLGYRWRCLTCGHESETNNPNFECEKAVVLISLDDFNIAMSYRDKAVEEFGWRNYRSLLHSVYMQSYVTEMVWEQFLMTLKPRDYLIAAANLEQGEGDGT